MATILIVDDDESLLRMLELSLTRAGHTVCAARDGDEALRQLREASVQLMVTDVIMPGKEGVELMLQLRTTMPDLKIIAMSGGGSLGSKTYLEIARGLGAVDTLHKPFSISSLVNKVNRALEQPKSAKSSTRAQVESGQERSRGS